MTLAANRQPGCLYLPNGNPQPGEKFDYYNPRGAKPIDISWAQGWLDALRGVHPEEIKIVETTKI